MEVSSHKLTRQSNLAQLPAVIVLARKLLTHTWQLLLVTLCGMIACVGLICSIPLFTQVTIKTGIQQILTQQPGGQAATFSGTSDHPTADLIQQVGDTTKHLIQKDMSPYVDSTAQFTLQTPLLQTMDPKKEQAFSSQYVSVFGYDPALIAQKVKLLHGRLPQASATANQIEVVMTQPVATKLHLQVGDVQQVRYPSTAGSIAWQLHVVGIVSLRSTAGNIWQLDAITPSTADGVEPGSSNVLASLPTLLPAVAKIQETPLIGFRAIPAQATLDTLTPATKRAAPTTLVHTTTTPIISHQLQYKSNQQSNARAVPSDPDPAFTLYWSYPINVSTIDGNNFSDFTQDYNNALLSGLQYSHAHITDLRFFSIAIRPLIFYSSGVIVVISVTVFLLIAILGLALFMVSMLANILIENQFSVIVMLRSRGATQRHIFGAFTLQGLILGLTALVAGPACAILLVGGLGRLLLPTAPSPLAALTSNLTQTIGQIWILALITVIVALIVMIGALRRASMIDIVALRQNSSRTKHKPFWKRAYLDFFLALIIIAGIAYAQLILNAGNSTAGNGLNVNLAPLAYLAIPLTLLTVTLFFLRFFPWMTRVGTRIITKRKAAPGVLAFAQMERQPHATLRMILLLSLSLASAIYLCTFIATQHNWIQDSVNFQVGADFSGTIDTTGSSQSFQQLQAHYASQPGVQAATTGYNETIGDHDNIPTIVVNAVNAESYAQTAVWSPVYTSQPLPSLTGQLSANRSNGIAKHEVYAVVDTKLWQALHLTPGATFTLGTSDAYFKHITFVAMEEANYLPALPSGHLSAPASTLLIDYQNYAAVYAHENQNAHLQPNYLWLKTPDTAQALNQVRHEFPTFNDRRALTEAAMTEPLQTAITGTLIIGLIVTFLLVLIGVGLTAWMSVKQRRTSFSVLRALGMTPGQIARILLWEQGFTYVSALGLGLFIGWLSTFFIPSAFSLIAFILQVASTVFDNVGLPLQKSAQIPATWLGLMFAIFILICGTTLLFVSTYGTRPVLGQALRINED